MNREQLIRELEDWADELKTTTKLQGTGDLKKLNRNESKYEYCCLGILAEKYCGEIKEGHSFFTPSFEEKYKYESILIEIFSKLYGYKIKLYKGEFGSYAISGNIQSAFAEINDSKRFYPFKLTFKIGLEAEDENDNSFIGIGHLIIKYKERIADVLLKHYQAYLAENGEGVLQN